MPELPEVEVVRAGLERGLVGRTVRSVQVHHPRAVRRHPSGPADFADRLAGRTITAACRRGKYLWLPLDSGQSLLAHLGMSGQLLVVPAERPEGPHLRVRVDFLDGGRELRFVDQRTLGGLAVCDGGGLDEPPGPVAHIARDPMDPLFDDAAFLARLRGRRTWLKRALLDQTLVSGIGNIYADETLWRVRRHWAQPTDTLSVVTGRRLLAAVRAVLADALAAGGTSFDALYLSAEGVSGRFARSLHAYGRGGQPCDRCGTPLVREPFLQRSSVRCPRCQPAPVGVERIQLNS